MEHRTPQWATPEHNAREAEWQGYVDPERFWSNVQPQADGCWLWQAKIDHNGYGRLAQYRGGERKHWAAHRLAYWLYAGPIPVGLTLDHTCRVRHCVNPEHLEPVTMGENTARGAAWDYQRSKTHCSRGHAYEGENVRYNQGRRECRACDREDAREKRARLAAQRAAIAATPKPCRVEGCDAPRAKQRTMCSLHYSRKQNFGSEFYTPPPRALPKHGSVSMYRGTPTRPGCRCDLCKQAQRDHLDRYCRPYKRAS